MSVPERWQEVGENSNDNEVWILSSCSPLIDSKSRGELSEFSIFSLLASGGGKQRIRSVCPPEA